MRISTLYRIFLAAFALLCLASCDSTKKISKDYLYFQNDRQLVVKSKLKEVTIKPNDLLTIFIYTTSLNQDQTKFVNLAADQGYIVDSAGMILVPTAGKIKAGGLNRYQLQDVIKEKLRKDILAPEVVVRFKQFQINVLGEVASPGTKNFPTEKVTIFDAIGQSGDLTPTGLRKDVTISREEEGGVRRLYEIDLTSNDVFTSEVYQLQQNDIVYVNANKSKLRSINSKTDVSRIVQLGLSVIGGITTLYFLFRNR